jgi:hypothetical protein
MTYARYRFLQLQEIHELARSLQLSDSRYRELLMDLTGVDSAKGLKELIAEINHFSEMRTALEVVNGGTNPGTFVVKELVYAYAMWISAKFHLQVIRAYDALVTANSLTIPHVLTPSQFERRQSAILEAQEALNRATIQMSVAEYEAILDQRTVYCVPGKALALMEKYGIPRDEICQAAGINRNNLRQHLHIARQAGSL